MLAPHLKKILAGLWVLLLAGVIFFYFSHGWSLGDLQGKVAAFGALSALVYIVLYAVRPLLFFPASILTPLAAVLFGPYLGWVYAYIGGVLSAAVAFLLARYFGRQFVSGRQNMFIKKYDAKLRDHGFETVLTLRLIPLFPFDFVNFASGLSAISFGRYMLGTMLGIIPGLSAYIFLGGSIANPYFLIPTIIFFGILTYAARRYQKRSELKKYNQPT